MLIFFVYAFNILHIRARSRNNRLWVFQGYHIVNKNMEQINFPGKEKNLKYFSWDVSKVLTFVKSSYVVIY